MNDKIKKITDVVTIVFPAVIAVAGALNATGAITILNSVHGVIIAVLGGLASVASLTYNVVTDSKAKE